MTAIYRLMIKNRWYLFIGMFMTAFMMNLIIWNETSQLIRNHRALEIMQKEARKGSFDLIYYPESSQLGETVKGVREDLYQHLSLLSKQGKIFYNKVAYLQGGDLLSLDQGELTKNLLEAQLSPLFLNDLILRDLNVQEFADLEAIFLALGDEVKFISFKDQYEVQQAYYWNNLFFSLGAGGILFVIALLLLRWLLISNWRICQDEIRVLRLVGLSNVRLKKEKTLFLYSPIVLALLTFMVSTYLIFHFGLILWDYVYLLGDFRLILFDHILYG